VEESHKKSPGTLQTKGNRGNRVSSFIRLPALVAVCALIALHLAGEQSLAATFTPNVTTELGYTDNIRFTRNPRKDGYFKVSPGASISLGKPTNQFNLTGRIDYIYYFNFSEETGLDGGSLNAAYQYKPNPKWEFLLQNIFSSTYDQAQVDPQGNFVRVRDEGGRWDNNVTTVRGQHNFGPNDNVYASYSYGINRYTEDDESDFDQHRLATGGTYRFNPNWQAELELSGTHTAYEKKPDEQTRGAKATLARMIGPHRKAFMSLSYSDVRLQDAEPDEARARDYEVYGASLGYEHTVSPVFSWGVSAGVSRVEGDPQANRAAEDQQPVFNAWTKFKGQKWNLKLFAEASFGEYLDYGDAKGLSYTQTYGGDFFYQLARLWTFSLSAVYIHDDYKQNPDLAGLDPNGNINTYQLSSSLAWQVARNASMRLGYRYTKQDGELDVDDRQENRVFLSFSYNYPIRW
jgi:hypothetical protein